MAKPFAHNVISFYRNIAFNGRLPKGITMMNPYRDSKDILRITETFYRKFYEDNQKRHLILGINPGRLGAGVTGIPFTDSKRLSEICGIDTGGLHTYEPSSVFMYDMMAAFGGVAAFYGRYYISSVCPLGFTATNSHGREVNYNYYDSPALQKAVQPFIEWNIATQIAMGCHTDVCYCLGTGRNYRFLNTLNAEKQWFRQVVPLEHPRYVIQYKLKEKERYVAKYLEVLG
jgi:hypothetical protein